MDNDIVKGTQSISRAIALLKTIALHPVNGWRLADLIDQCELEDATARRVLKALVSERLVARRACDGRYVPGPLLYELGVTTYPHSIFQSQCEPYLAKLSKQFTSAAFVYLRSGFEFVCIALRNPLSPKGIVLPIGTRRSLGLAAGGMAMIMALEESQRSSTLSYCEGLAKKRGAKALSTFRNISTRSIQYGAGVNLNDGLGGVGAISVALVDKNGEPFASIGVGNSVERLTELGVTRILDAVRADARTMEHELMSTIHAFSSVGF